METEKARAKNAKLLEREIIERVMNSYSCEFNFTTTDMTRSRRALTSVQSSQLQILVAAKSSGGRVKKTSEIRNAECRLYACTKLLSNLHQSFSEEIKYED